MASEARLPRVATGGAVLGLGLLLSLDRAGVLNLGWGWSLPLLCVVGGSGLLAVAAGSSDGAYAGVLTRVALRRGVPLWPLRTATLLTAPLAGFGVAAYAGLAFWQTLEEREYTTPQIDWRRTTGTALLGLGIVLACVQAGAWLGGEAVLWSVLLAGTGLSLFWCLPDTRRQPAIGTNPHNATVRLYLALGLAGGAALFVLGTTGLFSQGERTIVGTGAAILVLALMVGPRWLRTRRVLGRERLERARANERSEIAGLLHDSVLQTLALINDRADDAKDVRALVRRQERDLRAWLLGGPSPAAPPRSVGMALRAMAAEVEDAHRVKIEVVTVGDAPLGSDFEALIAAAREALVNAARHAPGAPISLFGEIEEGRVAAYVRDRGPGFDLDAIPTDRHGVRDSIIARMARHGGHAAIRTAPGGGCEVQLVQERPR